MAANTDSTDGDCDFILFFPSFATKTFQRLRRQVSANLKTEELQAVLSHPPDFGEEHVLDVFWGYLYTISRALPG